MQNSVLARAVPCLLAWDRQPDPVLTSQQLLEYLQSARVKLYYQLVDENAAIWVSILLFMVVSNIVLVQHLLLDKITHFCHYFLYA